MLTHSLTRIVRPPTFSRGATPLALVVAGLLAVPREASALQPLAEFIRAARSQNFDAREQAAVVSQREDEAKQAWWKLAPVISASGSYTNNQYAAIATIPVGNPALGQTQSVTIMAQNQLDATFSATLPIVDIGAWERVGASHRTAIAARAQAGATELDVQRAVAQAYFQVVAEEAVLRSSNERRDTAQSNLDFVRTRNSAGVAPELDLKRAEAEFESARQDVTEAEYQIRIARRSLATVAGLDPSPGGFELSDDTSPEPPLDSFTVGSSNLPSVLAASETARAAERTVNSTRAGLYPTLSATATERVTNAPGFGQSPYYQIVGTATWRFDGSTIAQTSAADRAAEAARVREERALREAEDVVFNDYQAVVRQIEKTQAARAQRESSALAANIARQRYEAGTANYLDVQTAARDDFAAKVALVQASADLAYARAALHLAAGRRLDSGNGGR
jgi:outer membrane protein TolC